MTRHLPVQLISEKVNEFSHPRYHPNNKNREGVRSHSQGWKHHVMKWSAWKAVEWSISLPGGASTPAWSYTICMLMPGQCCSELFTWSSVFIIYKHSTKHGHSKSLLYISCTYARTNLQTHAHTHTKPNTKAKDSINLCHVLAKRLNHQFPGVWLEWK